MSATKEPTQSEKNAVTEIIKILHIYAIDLTPAQIFGVIESVKMGLLLDAMENKETR